MNQRRFICLGILLCGLLVSIARADTFQLNDGTSVTGEIVSYNENGLRLRLGDSTYSDPIPWTKFSQDDLKKLAKDRLQQMRQADPQTKLAAALLAVARDHGFSSWRALKAEA